MANREGQLLGNYRLLRLLGQGAFTEVYLGKHLYMERPAAIKIPHFSHISENFRNKSFQDEARILARLHHPHVVGIYECGIEGETPYLVLEYLPNGTLRQRHPKGTRLSLEKIVVYVDQIASALDYIHNQRIIHRSVRPEDFLLNTKGEIVLSDFGIAVVQTSLWEQKMVGTPLYTAPEQIQGQPCMASDQYALGVMVYEWLCGDPPFRGQFFEVISQHQHKPPPSLGARPDLPPAVEKSVLRTLAKDPHQRFPSVQDFAKALSDACYSTQPLLGASSEPVKALEDEDDAPTQPLPILSSESYEQVIAPITSISAPLSTPVMQDSRLLPVNEKEEVMQNIEPIKLFYCYVPEDRKLRDELETSLMVLKRLRKITLQLNREIMAGTDWKQVQDERFHMADLILLLISPNFIKSEYHYGIEMHNALEKHKAGNVQVIPILLRPTPLWQKTPLGTLQMLPKNGKAITEHRRRDIVLADIAKTIGQEVSLLLTR